MQETIHGNGLVCIGRSGAHENRRYVSTRPSDAHRFHSFVRHQPLVRRAREPISRFMVGSAPSRTSTAWYLTYHCYFGDDGTNRELYNLQRIGFEIWTTLLSSFMSRLCRQDRSLARSVSVVMSRLCRQNRSLARSNRPCRSCRQDRVVKIVSYVSVVFPSTDHSSRFYFLPGACMGFHMASVIASSFFKQRTHTYDSRS